MCYSATHLEKLDPTREQQWQKVARLTPEDMAMVTNLEYLGVPGERQRQAMGARDRQLRSCWGSVGSRARVANWLAMCD